MAQASRFAQLGRLPTDTGNYVLMNNEDDNLTWRPSSLEVDFNDLTRQLTLIVDGVEQVAEIASSDVRTAMEIIRAAIAHSSTTRTTQFINGLPATFTYILANAQIITGTFVFRNGFPETITFEGSYIGEVSAQPGARLQHRFTFVNGFPTQDTWNFLATLEAAVFFATNGRVIEQGDEGEALFIGENGRITNSDVTILLADNGRIINLGDV